MQFILKLLVSLIPVAIYLFYFPHAKNKLVSILTAFFLLAITTIFIIHVGKETYSNYKEPPVWDFQVFWLNGRVAAHGLNFYIPDNYRMMAQTLKPDAGFTREILDVGFWYPPMSMFLFAPLGWFNISNAYLLWQLFFLVICIACILALWRSFPKENGMLSLLLVSALVFRLNPVHTTFHFSQTNFIALFFFLLFWLNKSKDWSGIFLALCVVVKPYMALLYMYPLFARKWRMLLVAGSALIIITILSIIAFGPDVFASFFTQNPTSKLPVLAYTEEINQSLLSTILRLDPTQIPMKSPLLNPLYLGTSLLLTLITVWVTAANKDGNDWVLLSILFLALIVYPASLEHYSVFLILPVILLIRDAGRNTKERIAIFFIVFTIYFLSGYDSGGRMFFANLFMWLVCIVLGAKPIFEKPLLPDSQIANALHHESVELG